MFKFLIFAMLVASSMVSVKLHELNVVIEDEQETQQPSDIDFKDPCDELKCGLGQQCVFVDESPICACIEQCEIPRDDRLKICTTANQTYDSECHFNREKCWCSTGDFKCSDASLLNQTLDYYGSCQYIPVCTSEHKSAFPNRIKIWLDEVLFILNDRKDLDENRFGHLVSLANQMKQDKVEKYWTCGVAFEFCQLDKSHNGIIEIDEMNALIAPIKALESCIQPFLQGCDANKDSKISDTEWATCLDLSDDDLKLLRSVCSP